jgi:hypothetical protein
MQIKTVMRANIAIAAVVVTAICLATSASSSGKERIERLDEPPLAGSQHHQPRPAVAGNLNGRWAAADGSAIEIDHQGQQARESGSPWQPFVVRDVQGSMVTFQIGPDAVFIGAVKGSTLLLTRTGQPGTRSFSKVEPGLPALRLRPGYD